MPTVGAANKLFSNAWPMAHFVINFCHWAMVCNFRPHVDHTPGVDNDWADELSRKDIDTLVSRGWDPARRFVFSLRDVLLPSRGRVFPPEAYLHGPPALRALSDWLRAMGT